MNSNGALIDFFIKMKIFDDIKYLLFYYFDSMLLSKLEKIGDSIFLKLLDYSPKIVSQLQFNNTWNVLNTTIKSVI